MSVFVHAQGIKTVHAGGGGSKSGKILSTQLLNDPLYITLHFDFQGMAIGDGLCDPINMIDYGDFLFNIGLLDELDRNYFNLVQHDIKEYIKQEKYGDAFRIFDELLNGDTTTTSSYYSNVTGFTWYFNYLLKDGPKDLDYYTHLVEKDYVRKAIHVGNLTYNDGAKVEQFLFNDVMKSVKPWVEEIIESGYK